MLRLLIVMVYLSLLCHKSCVGRAINTVDTTQELGWQSWLHGDPSTPRPHIEEVKKRRINRRFIYKVPTISGTSPLPECAEGYRPDSRGQCIKVIKLNHETQLDFLLQRLNAKYATPVLRRGYEDHSASDSSSMGLLQRSIPFDIPPESEKLTKESADVAVVMTDVLKDNTHENSNKTNETQMSPTIVAVLNVGKNGTSLEDMDEEQFLLTTPTSVLLSEESGQTLTEQTKAPDSALGLIEDVGNMSSEDGRPGNAKNPSADEKAGKEETTETVTKTIELSVGNAAVTKYNRNRDRLTMLLLLLVLM
ncbi:hypothetical protein B7P43_G06963 [Cryptotermes secundus]|uniref:Folded gastrulation N-terminal domain-containing protein n=1 Tax=Cryptotermes secundus TaxID=105785 RepID=A0A2J7QN26_9NEOP|nr:hypothetical protein B7P43_G06963 [Cryptotermes secundus]